MLAKIPWLSIGRFALIVLCLIVVLATLLMVLPIYLDITAFKGPLEEILSGIAEAPVTVTEARLHPSLWPTLRISGIEVAGSGAGSPGPFAVIERAELQISLLPLLRDRIKVQRLFLADAIFHAHRPEAQKGNWPVWSESAVELEELAGIEFENVTVRLEDHDTVRATMVVDRLTCDIAASRPLDLQLQGSLEGLPLSATVGGPSLAVPLSQASDFPLNAALSLGTLNLEFTGSGSREPGGTRLQLAFTLESPDLKTFEHLFGVDLPAIGGPDLTGTLSNQGSLLQIDDLEGSVDTTSIRGRLTVEGGNARPALTGRLALGRLDLGPWLESSAADQTEPSEPVPFSLLTSADIHLELEASEIAGLPHLIRELDLEIDLEDGALAVPATLRFAEIPLSAELQIDTGTDAPEIAVRITTRDLALEDVGRLIEVSESLSGDIGALDLAISSRGETVNSLRTDVSLDARAQSVRLSVMDETGREPIEIRFSQVQASQRTGAPLTATAEGTLFQEAFVLGLETSPLEKLSGADRWPLTGSLQGAGATFGLRGSVERIAGGLDLDLDFSASGDRLGDLQNWLGIPAHIDLPFDLRGNLSSTADTRIVRLEDSSLGRTRLRGEFARNTEDDTQPFIITLHASTLDLQSLREISEPVTDLDTEEEVMGVDLPILPSKVTFHDAEIDLQVDRLLRDNVDLTDLEASFHFQEGQLARSPFSFAYDTQRFHGEIDLDLRGEIPRFRLEFRGDGGNLGQVLRKEGLIEDSGLVAERIDLRIDASGSSLRTIIGSADLSGRLDNVRWQIQPAGLEEPLEIQLTELNLSGPKGEPIEIDGKGTLEGEPLDLGLVLRMSKEIQDQPTQTVPFHLTAGLAGTTIEMLGEFELPVTKGDFETQTTVQGESLSTLSTLMGNDLPDLGPYRLNTRLVIGDDGLMLRNIDFLLGESDLSGEIRYAKSNGRPTFKADLTSQLIRTEDLFDFDPQAAIEEEASGRREGPSLPENIGRFLRQIEEFDAELDLTSREFRTAGGPFREMDITADLQLGSLDLRFRRPQDTGEDAELIVQIQPLDEGIEADFRASWTRQPWGVLGEILAPDGSQGNWSIDLELGARGGDAQELASTLTGHLYFANYPVDASATLFDLWGGGLLKSLLPVFQLGEESRVNCSVAKFQVAEGILTPSVLLIDSTRTRVRGKGSIDLAGNEIRLRLRPRPKQRNLINLSTPVKIRGPLTKPDAEISKGGLAVTFFRLSLWIYTVWRDIARRPLPADGSDVCLDPFAAPAK